MPFGRTISRRQCLKVGVLGASGLTLPRLLQAEAAARKPAKARSCLLLFMDGGASHIDLFDLKPEAPLDVRGPFQSIDSRVPGIRVSEHLPRLAGEMHRVLQVRSMTHEASVHDPAVYQMLTGHPHVSSSGGLEVEDSDYPHMATAFGFADRTPAAMPKVIELPQTMTMGARVLPGQNAGFLGASFDPFRVEVTPEGQVQKPEFTLQPGMNRDRFARRSLLMETYDQRLGRLAQNPALAKFDIYQQQALEILSHPGIQEAFDLEREPPKMRESYGLHRHGQSVLLARRLLEAGSRFVTVYWGNEPQDWADGRGPTLANNPWDTHRNHFPLVRDSLLPRADQALSALLDDLAQRGELEETLVVWMGEFGRTPKISKPWASRDHWPNAFTILLAGAGIRGGAVYGRTDRLAASVTEDPVTPADLTATIFNALGVDPQSLIREPGGAFVPISPGRVIDEWFG